MSGIDTSTRRIFLGLLLGGGILLGQPGAVARAEPPAQSAGQPAGGDDFTSYSFDDDSVFGTTARPDGEVLPVRRRGQRESLIRTRESFVRELLKSVEAL
jgi:hypothetical protein